MKKRTLLLSSIFFCFAYVTGQNRINIPAGLKLRSVNNSTSTITQNAMGQEIEVKSTAIMNLDATVKEISPAIHLNTKIARLQVTSTVMGNKNDFDSDKKEDKDGQMGQLLSGLLEKPFDLFIHTDGKPIKNKAKSDPSTEAAKGMAGNLDDLGSEFLLAIPVSMKAGDSWIEEVNEDADNKKYIEYKVLSINNPDAVVSFQGTSISKTNKSVQGIEALVTGSAVIAGELTVNAASGLIKQKKTDTESKGVTEMMGQSIHFTIKQITTSHND